MVQIEAFRGIRYDLGHVGSLADVIAPPYDVIDDTLRDQLYDRHAANVIRLILNRSEPGDKTDEDRYQRAARLFKQWQRQGLLMTEGEAAIYVYHQVFEYQGEQFTRRGFMSRMRLEPLGEGTVFPHEETHAAAKADRLKLYTACRAQLSQIFGIYPDPDNTAQGLLEAAVAGDTPLEAVDHLGVIHRIWPVSDVKLISELSAAMGSLPLYIADGHHRYETACNYQQQLIDEQGELSSNHPAQGVLMMAVSMNDPGMIVLPTHRLLRGMPAMSSSQLIAALGDCFDIEPVGEQLESAQAAWETIAMEDEQGTIGLYCPVDSAWLLVRINGVGRDRMAEIATDRSESWRSLGVSILHKLIVETLLGQTEAPKPDYVHLVDELVAGLKGGDEAGVDYPLAALVMPASLDHIREVSQQGERMPAKSTYFYPKLLSGLVIHQLE
jgi:uncharacterized protein (DUF1015 family)